MNVQMDRSDDLNNDADEDMQNLFGIDTIHLILYPSPGGSSSSLGMCVVSVRNAGIAVVVSVRRQHGYRAVDGRQSIGSVTPPRRTWSSRSPASDWLKPRRSTPPPRSSSLHARTQPETPPVLPPCRKRPGNFPRSHAQRTSFLAIATSRVNIDYRRRLE